MPISKMDSTNLADELGGLGDVGLEVINSQPS